MNSVAVPPYRAYRPRPFTRQERTQVAILFGGLHWRAERVIQAVFANQGSTRIAPPGTARSSRASRIDTAPRLAANQLYEALKDVLPGLTRAETGEAVEEGYRALDATNRSLRQRSRTILEACARSDKPCILVLARPYHMDSGIGREIPIDKPRSPTLRSPPSERSPLMTSISRSSLI